MLNNQQKVTCSYYIRPWKYKLLYEKSSICKCQNKSHLLIRGHRFPDFHVEVSSKRMSHTLYQGLKTTTPSQLALHSVNKVPTSDSVVTWWIRPFSDNIIIQANPVFLTHKLHFGKEYRNGLCPVCINTHLSFHQSLQTERINPLLISSS